jgi:hypothetical protein
MRLFVLVALLLLTVAAGVPQTSPLTVRGEAEDTAGAAVGGVRLDFLLWGSSEKKTAVTGPDGKYSIELPVGRYEIQLTLPGRQRPQSEFAFLGPADRKEVVLNVRVPKDAAAALTEYDTLGDWRVVDQQGRRVGPAKVTFEALQRDGRRVTFPVYVPVLDEEKEVNGPVNTDPAGRFVFRIREAHLAADRVVALIVTAEAPGYLPRSERIFPALQFSETGHLYAAYPEEGVKITLKPRP